MLIAAGQLHRPEEEEEESAVDMPQSRLHNFSLPPLSWGNQRHLRCVKLADGTLGSAIQRSSSSSPEEESAAAATKPWNLRTRRAACYQPNGIGDKKWNPNSHSSASPSPLRSRSGKGERRRFSVALPHAEIEEDFFSVKGIKLSRRPKKRLKAVQRQLDPLFPGLGLTEVTLDLYKVEDER